MVLLHLVHGFLASCIVTATSQVTECAGNTKDEISRLHLLQTGFEFKSTADLPLKDHAESSEEVWYNRNSTRDGKGGGGNGHRLGKQRPAHLIGTATSTLALVSFIGCWIVLACYLYKPHSVDAYLDKKGNAHTPRWSLYQRFFFKHYNLEWGRNSEHAFRGACVFVLYALPFFLESGVFPFVSTLIEQHVYSICIGQLFLFTYLQTMGCTIRMAAQTGCGTMIAVLTIWVMLGIFPTGVRNDTTGHVYTFGIVCGAVYMFLVLWLNIPLKVRIFSLLRFGEYLMAFLNPEAHVEENYSVGFHISFTGKAMQAVCALFAGSILAIVANLLPYPHFALNQATEECLTVVGLLKDGWITFADFIRGEEKSMDMVSRMQRELYEIKGQLDTCDFHLKSAWWECFGWGARQHKRALLGQVSHSTREMYLELLGASESCTADETFGSRHLEFIEPIRDLTTTLVDQIGEALYLIAGSISENPDVKQLNACVEGMSTSVKSLSKDFHAVKRDLSLPSLDAEYFEEHVFCRALCRCARMTSELAQTIIDEFEGRKVLGTKYNGPDFSSVFDMQKIMRKDKVLVSAKLTITMTLCFSLGYFGYEGTYTPIIAPYSHLIPCTAALLIAPGRGVQLQKNLMRLEGVVLGTALGAMFHSIFDQCHWFDTIGSAVSMHIWIWLCLIGYFGGKEYSYLLFLLALFGQSEIVHPCGLKNEVHSFTMIYKIVAAIAIMTFVDFIAPVASASEDATETVTQAWSKLADAFDKLMNEQGFENFGPGGDFANCLNHAIELEPEAPLEMRFWKTPWRRGTYNCCTEALRLIRTSLYTIEDCMPETPKNREQVSKRRQSGTPRRMSIRRTWTMMEDEEGQALRACLRMQSMKTIQSKLKENILHMVQMMIIFNHTTSNDVEELDYKNPKQTLTTGLEDAWKDFAADASKQDLTFVDEESLEFDMSCKLSHVCACFQAMNKQVKSLKSKAILHG